MTAPSTVACSHCGAGPLSGVAGRDESFCCSGCWLAYRLQGRAAEGNSDRLLARLVLSAFLAMGVMVFSLALYGELLSPDAQTGEAAAALRGLYRLAALALSLPVLVLLGVPLTRAMHEMGRPVSTETLVVLGAGTAFAVSAWNTFAGRGEVYFDTATAVLVLFTLGRWLDARTRERASGHLGVLARERVASAIRVGANDDESVPLEELRIADEVRVLAGERVPADGVIVEGSSWLDRSLLTGEATHVSVAPGERVLAGSLAVDGSLVVRVEAAPGDCVRDEAEKLLSEARRSQAQLVRVADQAANVLLPVVLTVAAAAAIWHGTHTGWDAGLWSGLSVLLVACPCALGIATPLAFWVALGEAWKLGALVRRADVFERLARVGRVRFDKTGTLTESELEVATVETRADWKFREALRLAAALERGSNHPIARALISAWPAESDEKLPSADSFHAEPGIGVEGVVEGHRIRLQRAHPSDAVPAHTDSATRVSLERWDPSLAPPHWTPIATFGLSARIRPAASNVLRELTSRGLDPRVLTGDSAAPAQHLGALLGVPVESELLPAGKLRSLDSEGATGVLYVGDGWNDAAALAAADVGVSMPRGARTTIESAEVNLMKSDLNLVVHLLDLGRAATRVARLNLAWAVGYNAIGLALAAAGRLTPVVAALAMIGSSLFIVGTSSHLSGWSKARVRPHPPRPSGPAVRMQSPSLRVT